MRLSSARAETRRPRRSEEHTSELQSRRDLVCRLLLEKKNQELTSRGLPNTKEVEAWTLAPYQIFYNLNSRTRNLKLAYRARYNRALHREPVATYLLLL